MFGGWNRSDVWSIITLVFLYVLQGIPMGLADAVPLLLQRKDVHMSLQAMFSFTMYPFSLKLLWAPVVDAVWSRRIGRRKSWLIPSQLLAGCIMITLSSHDYVSNWLGEGASSIPDVPKLTLVFGLLYLTMATQDIAVDGWALTMLSPACVSYQATCNTVGQTMGSLISYVSFLAFSNPEFCNRYFRSVPQYYGMVTMSGFLQFWGTVFVVSTIIIFLFKTESPHAQPGDNSCGAVTLAYQHMWQTLKLPSVRSLVMVLLTARIGFAALEGANGLKLVERGFPSEQLAFFSTVLTPLGILCPLFLSRFVSARPLDFYLRIYVPRLLVGVSLALCVFFSAGKGVEVSWPFYTALLCLCSLQMIVANAMSLSLMSFFAKISDPRMGGTYMTLLATFLNLGGMWPSTFSLWSIGQLTKKQCVIGSVMTSSAEEWATCSSGDLQALCIQKGGQCLTIWEGYYMVAALGLLFGLFWFSRAKHHIGELARLPQGAWRVITE